MPPWLKSSLYDAVTSAIAASWRLILSARRRKVATPSMRRSDTSDGMPAEFRRMGSPPRMKCWTSAASWAISDQSTAWISSMVMTSPVPFSSYVAFDAAMHPEASVLRKSR